jgi:hypothetical protein
MLLIANNLLHYALILTKFSIATPSNSTAPSNQTAPPNPTTADTATILIDEVIDKTKRGITTLERELQDAVQEIMDDADSDPAANRYNGQSRDAFKAAFTREAASEVSLPKLKGYLAYLQGKRVEAAAWDRRQDELRG